MKKIIILKILLLTSSVLMAQQSETKDLVLSAKASPGCNISASDFNFGTITTNSLINAGNISLTNNILMQCSKKTKVSLTQYGKAYFGAPGYNLNIMTLNGKVPYESYKFIRYSLTIDPIVNNNEYTVNKYPQSSRLGAALVDGYSFSLDITTKTGNEFLIPIKAIIMNENNYRLFTGDYRDTVTYTVTY